MWSCGLHALRAGMAEARGPETARLDRGCRVSVGSSAIRRPRATGATAAPTSARDLARATSTPPTVQAWRARSRARRRSPGCWPCGRARAGPRTRRWRRRRPRPGAFARARRRGPRGTVGRGSRPPAACGTRSGCSRLPRPAPRVFGGMRPTGGRGIFGTSAPGFRRA